jgi:hypothetical protein
MKVLNVIEKEEFTWWRDPSEIPDKTHAYHVVCISGRGITKKNVDASGPLNAAQEGMKPCGSNWTGFIAVYDNRRYHEDDMRILTELDATSDYEGLRSFQENEDYTDPNHWRKPILVARYRHS